MKGPTVTVLEGLTKRGFELVDLLEIPEDHPWTRQMIVSKDGETRLIVAIVLQPEDGRPGNLSPAEKGKLSRTQQENGAAKMHIVIVYGGRSYCDVEWGELDR